MQKKRFLGRKYSTGSETNEFPIENMQKGGIFGEEGVFGEEKRRYSAVATKANTILLRLSVKVHVCLTTI